MTKSELMQVLEVERYAPGPRPPRFSRCDPPAPITPEQAERNQALLLAALDGDGVVVAFIERESA